MKRIAFTALLSGAVLASLSGIGQADVVASWDFTQATDQLLDTSPNGHDLTAGGAGAGVTYDTTDGADFGNDYNKLTYDAAALNPISIGAGQTWTLNITGQSFNVDPIGDTYHAIWGNRQGDDGLFLYKYKNDGTSRANDFELWYHNGSGFAQVKPDVQPTSVLTDTYDFKISYEKDTDELTFGVSFDGGATFTTATNTVGGTGLNIVGDAFNFGYIERYPENFSFDGTIQGASIEVIASPDPSMQIDAAFSFENDGTAETLSLPFTNGGATLDLTVASVTPGGADATYFTGVSFTGTAIAPGDPGSIDFTFNPTDGVRTYTAEFTIVSNDSFSPSKVVTLTIDVNDPVLQIDSSFAFENHGASEDFQLPFTNAGGALNLTITSVTVNDGVDKDYFTIGTFTAPVAPGDPGTIDFTFDPAGSGAYEVQITIESNDPVSPTTVITVGVEVIDPAISLPFPELDFGTFAPNPGLQTLNVPVTNMGTLDLNIDSATLLRGGNGFAVTTVPTFVAPGGTENIVVTFDPGNGCGDFGDVLAIESDDSANFLIDLPVVAVVTIPGGGTALSIANADFEAGGWDSQYGTSPDEWVSDPPLTGNSHGNYGDTAPGVPNLTGISALLKGLAIDNYYQQDLAANNSGLTASQIDAVTVAFDQSYRNDARTAGDIFLRVSLWDITNDVEIVGRDLLIKDTGVLAGTAANQLAPAALKMPCDSSAYTTEEVAVRIAHILPHPANAAWATAILDNVTVTIDGSYTPTNNFDSWATGYGIPADENDDSDHDGIPAIMEYGIGYNPTVPESMPQPVASGADYTVTWPKGADAAADPEISYLVEVSDDLVAWGAPAPPNSLAESATELVLTLGAGQDKIFARLTVTHTTP